MADDVFLSVDLWFDFIGSLSDAHVCLHVRSTDRSQLGTCMGHCADRSGRQPHSPAKSKYWEREQQKKQGSCSTEISDPDFLPSLALVMLSAWNASQRLLTVTTSAGWAGKSLSSWKMSRQLLQTVGMPKFEDSRIVPLPVTYRATIWRSKEGQVDTSELVSFSQLGLVIDEPVDGVPKIKEVLLLSPWLILLLAVVLGDRGIQYIHGRWCAAAALSPTAMSDLPGMR